MLKPLVLAAKFFCLTAPAPQAATIGFEDLTVPNGFMHYRDSGFSTSGFEFTLSYGFAIDRDFRYTRYYASNNGTDWLMHNSFGDLDVKATDGGAFTLYSVDAGQWRRNDATEDVQVTGYRADGSTIAETIASKAQFETKTFSGWSNLLRVTLSGNGFGTYDNFVLAASSVTPVPAPAPVLLLGSALGIAGFVGRKRKKQRLAGKMDH